MARTRGLDILEKLNDGSMEVAPSDYLKKTRDDVSAALEEMVDVGARIRPLIVDKRRVGWVRGVHLAERRALRRWVTDDIEFVEILLGMATTLTRDEIRDLNLREIRSLSRLVQAMTDSDLRLYAYISAFVTTSHSEQTAPLIRPAVLFVSIIGFVSAPSVLSSMRRADTPQSRTIIDQLRQRNAALEVCEAPPLETALDPTVEPPQTREPPRPVEPLWPPVKLSPRACSVPLRLVNGTEIVLLICLG